MNLLFASCRPGELFGRRLEQLYNIVSEHTDQNLLFITINISIMFRKKDHVVQTMTIVMGDKTQSRICGSRYRETLK